MMGALSEAPWGHHTRGYLMIKAAEIQNFRGFKNVNLSDLTRVNVIVGDNATGKTALLEALFLASATSPEVAVRFRTWRGVDAPSATGSPQELYDGFFLDLFHEFKKDRVPAISVTGTEQDSRSLRFYYDRVEPTLLPFTETHQGQSRAYVPITFEWKDANGQTTKVTPQFQPTGIVIPPSPQLKHDPAFLAARAPIPTSQNARWFSDLSKWGREKQFISTVQTQFKYVESLSVEVDMGNPVIFVKFPWLDRKMPIYLASDGLNKLVTLLLGIAHSEGTAFFIDEVENGFHFSRHERLWEQLLSFADEYETQLFLTTHSWECLKAATPLISRLPDDFSMIQVFQKSGVGNAVVVPGRDAAAAIENEIEVRGNGDHAPEA
jgi:AAA domain, putative AbiEii toxin, Type IV TA system